MPQTFWKVPLFPGRVPVLFPAPGDTHCSCLAFIGPGYIVLGLYMFRLVRAFICRLYVDMPAESDSMVAALSPLARSVLATLEFLYMFLLKLCVSQSSAFARAQADVLSFACATAGRLLRPAVPAICLPLPRTKADEAAAGSQLLTNRGKQLTWRYDSRRMHTVPTTLAVAL